MDGAGWMGLESGIDMLWVAHQKNRPAAYLPPATPGAEGNEPAASATNPRSQPTRCAQGLSPHRRNGPFPSR